MICDSKRRLSTSRSRWATARAILLMVVVLAFSMSQAVCAESGKKEADKKAAAAKSKTHAAAKSEAAKEHKPKTDAAAASRPAEPKRAPAKSEPANAAGEAASPEPAKTPAPAASEAPAEPKPSPAAEPANPTPNEIVRERSKGLPQSSQPAAETKPSTEPTASPAPADAAKPPAPEEKPTTRSPTDEPAAATTNPAVPAGEVVPSAAPATPALVPSEQATEPVPQASPPAPVPAACNRAEFRMAIDVGHTETNYGAVSAHGKHEFDFNRRLAHDLADKLWHSGFDQADLVIQTDSDLARRARDLSSRRPNLMLSLHHDSVQDKYLKTAMLDGQMRTFTEGFHGYSIFVSHENAYREDSDRFAKTLGAEMIAQGLKPTFHHHVQENRPILDKQTGVFQYDGLAVLRLTTAPAVLLESAVITDPEDETKADDPAYRKRITNAIVAAVIRFCDENAARAQSHAAPPAAETQGSRK